MRIVDDDFGLAREEFHERGASDAAHGGDQHIGFPADHDVRAV